MHTWSVFFLINAVITGLIAFSMTESVLTTSLKVLATFHLLVFLLLIRLELGNRNGRV